jgi:hypothetical protein
MSIGYLPYIRILSRVLLENSSNHKNRLKKPNKKAKDLSLAQLMNSLRFSYRLSATRYGNS